MTETRTQLRGQPVGRWTRCFVWAYLAAFVIAGLAGFEAWPLTGWRLFADARTARQLSWEAATVDAAGREQPIPFSDLPVRYQGNVQVLKGFPSLPQSEQAAVCHAWADAVRQRGGDVREVRIYRREVDVARRAGRRGAPPHRTLRYTCRGGTVQAAGGRGG
ncbi:MAG TPA: hypothetical protein VFA46_21280 [Actinomycetes bacterium]|jgi:hypothetical protein|nr:hypothetical protein [Actinomycetes bacterium]